MRVTMLLADAAQEVNGKLYVLGGGWSVTGPDLPPMAIAIKLDVPWSAANAQHAFILELVDEDGRAVPAGDSGGGAGRGHLRGRPPGGAARRQRHRLRLRRDDPAVPDRPGRYTWQLSIDGESHEDWVRPFQVRARRDRRRHPRPTSSRVLDALYDPRWAAGVGRRRAGHRRPRPAGTPGAARRRPGAGRDRRGRRRGAPTCSSPTTRCCCAACTRWPTTHPKGRAVTALVRAGVALHVAHTNADVADPGVSDALAERARAHRPAAAACRLPPDAARQARDVRPRGRRRAGRRRAGRGRRRPARRLRAVRLHLAGHRHVHAAARGATRRSARVGSREQVAETRVEMVLRPRTGVRPWWRRCGPRTPTRSRRSTCSSWRALPGGRGLGRVGTLAGRRDAARARRAGGARRCRRPPAGCGSAATRTGRSARSRSAGERATTCSTRSGPRAPTPTSPPTCATTRRPRRSSTGRPALVDVSHWASEWPWLADCERLLRERARRPGGYGGDAGVPARHRPVGRTATRPSPSEESR